MGGLSEQQESVVGPGAAAMRRVGLWRSGEAAGWWGVGRGCLTLGAVAFVALSAALKAVADPPRELAELANCSFLAVICSMLCIRGCHFVWSGRTLRQLVRLLADTQARHSQGPANQATRRRCQRRVRRVYKLFQVAEMAALADWLLSPLLTRVLLGGDRGRRALPLPILLPAAAYASPTYELLYAAQCLGLSASAVCTFYVDMFFINVMQVIGAEFQVLGDNISAVHKICERSAKGRNRPTVRESQTKEETQASSCAHINIECVSDEQIYRQLSKNIQHHQEILRSISHLQSAISVPVYVLLLMNMVNLCANLFIATLLLQRDGNVSKALEALMTIPPLLFETAIYCISGHALTDQSEKLTVAAFSSGWEDCDVRVRRLLLTFMTVTMKPAEITVGKMTKLSKQTLLQVLNGTYGLLNMFYQLHNEL